MVVKKEQNMQTWYYHKRLQDLKLKKEDWMEIRLVSIVLILECILVKKNHLDRLRFPN